MSHPPFKKGFFLTSALKTDELPPPTLPEVVIVGRSNVGKSSLINHLLHSKNLAKVSSKPGKTQRINYFNIDNIFMLIDLPGYGYAKTSKTLQHEWSQWIDKYLHERKLQLILFLIDSRRTLTTEDLQFIEWATHAKIPMILIATKHDKLSQKETHACIKRLKTENSLSRLPHILYSVKYGECRITLIQSIHKQLWD